MPPHQRAEALRGYDCWLYRERPLVECYIGKINIFAVSFPTLISWIGLTPGSCILPVF